MTLAPVMHQAAVMRNPNGRGVDSEWLEISKEIAEWLEDIEKAPATGMSQVSSSTAPAPSQPPGLRRVDEAIAALAIDLRYDLSDCIDEETWPGVEPPPWGPPRK